MNQSELLNQLALSQSLVLTLVEQNTGLYNQQTDPDLSPLGWHLGHCVFFECYWLHEIILGNDKITRPLAKLYVPPRTPKNQRGAQLPPCDTLLDWVRQMQVSNLQTLLDMPSEVTSHPLLVKDYLLHFLIQHYSQHYETMIMVLMRKTLTETSSEYLPGTPLQSTEIAGDRSTISAGHYHIGGQKPMAYDNELPPQHVQLGSFQISSTPVSNAEFLGFMIDDGYQQADLWDKKGLAWQQRYHPSHPDHWRQDKHGNWYAVGVHGPYELVPDEPVMGLNYFESSAFANWAGGRLPHEYQWETACRLQKLQLTGHVWEWCQNSFHPYEGYQPFPYNDYSKPWFEGHYSLRGGSLHTRPAIKRPSFRNFYQPDKRFVFAGLRLVW